MGTEAAEAIAAAIQEAGKKQGTEWRDRIVVILISGIIAFGGSWMGVQVSIATLEARLAFQESQMSDVTTWRDTHQTDHLDQLKQEVRELKGQSP